MPPPPSAAACRRRLPSGRFRWRWRVRSVPAVRGSPRVGAARAARACGGARATHATLARHARPQRPGSPTRSRAAYDPRGDRDSPPPSSRGRSAAELVPRRRGPRAGRDHGRGARRVPRARCSRARSTLAGRRDPAAAALGREPRGAPGDVAAALEDQARAGGRSAHGDRAGAVHLDGRARDALLRDRPVRVVSPGHARAPHGSPLGVWLLVGAQSRCSSSGAMLVRRLARVDRDAGAVAAAAAAPLRCDWRRATSRAPAFAGRGRRGVSGVGDAGCSVACDEVGSVAILRTDHAAARPARAGWRRPGIPAGLGRASGSR